MLYLENLEPRCLLSVMILDNVDNPLDFYMSFDQTMIGEQSPIFPYEHVQIGYVDGDPDTSITVDVKIEDSEHNPGKNFFVEVPGNEPITLDNIPNNNIPDNIILYVYFTPREAGDLSEYLIIETDDDGGTMDQVTLFGTGLDVSFYPPDDSTLLFYTGVGQVQEGSIGIQYADGLEDPLIISGIEVTGNCFSFEQPAPPETLPRPYLMGFSSYTADEVIPLKHNQIYTGTLGTEPDAFGRPILDSYDIYSFQAQVGQMIDVRGLLENSGNLTIQAYTNSGELLTWDTVTYTTSYGDVFTNVTFPAPYTGLYYAEVYGSNYVDPDTYEIMVSSSVQTIPEVPLNEDPLAPVFESYEGTIGNEQFYDEETQWLQFDAEFGDQIDFQIDIDDPNAYLSTAIFDKNGRLIFDDTYFASDRTVTLQADGPYYIRVTDSSLLVRSDYEITLVKLGSILELEPGDTLQLPVYFRPDSLGVFRGSIEFQTSSPVVTSAHYTLYGESYPGDLAIVDVAAPNLTEYTYDQTNYPYAQSGEPLDVVATISNQGGGDIQQSADLVYYLSIDDVYGNEDDIQLSPYLPVNPLFVGNSDVVSGSVNLPDNLEGEYYLIAVVDPFNKVPEYPEPNPPEYWLVDPLVVEDELVPIIEPLILSPDNLLVTDSADDPFDRLIDYGGRPLNTFNTEYVWLLNRGSSPVTVTSYSLETGGVFQFPDPGSPDYQAPPIAIIPGQTANIPVIFAPEMFPLTGEKSITDTLTVQTSEGVTYIFDLYAEYAGANLMVLETSGEEINDSKMDLGTVRVGKSSSPALFSLVNLGDQALYINDIDFHSGNLTAFSYSLLGGGNLPISLQPFGAPGDANKAEFQLVFSPIHTGDFSDTLIIHSSDTSGDYSVQLSGVGVSPSLVVQESLGIANDNYLPFGWHPLNQPASTSIILSNAGTDALTLHGWQFQNAIPNDFQTDIPNNPAISQDDIILAPGESQILTITFLAASEGSFNDTLTIYSDDGQHEINLSSLAGQSALPSMQFLYNSEFYNTLALDIGNVLQGQSSSELFYIFNNGKVELTVDSINIDGKGFSLAGPGLTQPEVLQPGDKYQILVKFDATPDLPIQNFEGSIIITNTAQQKVVPVSSAIVTPEINLSSTVLDFGAINESQQKTLDLEISNFGNTELVITDWSTQDSQFVIEVPRQNIIENQLVLAPGENITAAITFEPQQFGIAQTQINLLSNDYDEPVSIVTLSAHNLGRPFEIQSHTTYAFYDADDDLVKISLSEGRATLYLNNGLWTGADIDTLMLHDTTPNSELKITVSGGQTTIGSLESEGSLGSIDTPKITINHSIAIKGSLDELLLNNVADGAAIHVSQFSSKPMTIKAEKIGQQVTFDLASNVKTFQASSYAGGNLTAPQMDLLKITNGSLGANVSVGSGSLKKLDVHNNITGNVASFDSIGKAASKTGGIFGSLTAQTGSIDNVTAKKNIAGNLYAAKDIDKVISKQGTFASTLRAENVNKIIARNIDGAIVSTLDNIGKVTSKKDVRDSMFLVGYDIGMSLADTTDDSLSGGSLDKLKFSNVLDNTFVAAGVMTDNIYIALGLPLPGIQPPNGAYGSIKVSGNQVNAEAGAPEFGFFAVDNISTNLEQEDNFIIAPNL